MTPLNEATLVQATTADYLEEQLGWGNGKAMLARYAENGELPIDNNPVGNAIPPIAVGKKNRLFAGSERAGRRAAAIQNLLATAKLNGLELSAAERYAGKISHLAQRQH